MKSRSYVLSFGALKLSQSADEQSIEVYTPGGSVVFTGKDLEALKKAAASLKEIKRKPGRQPKSRQPQKRQRVVGTSKQGVAEGIRESLEHGKKPLGEADKTFTGKLGTPSTNGHSANGHRGRALGRRKGDNTPKK